jgi:putative peptidoglycan lipid II flippase
MKRRPPSADAIARTAIALVPLQATFRAGEALLPLVLAAWFGRTAETDLYYLLAAYFVLVAAMIAGAFQDSGAVAVLIEVESTAPEAFDDIAGSLVGHTLAIGSAAALGMGSIAAAVVASTSSSSSRILALELVAIMSAGTVVTAVRACYVGLLNARGVFSAHPVASGCGTALTWALLYAGRGPLGVRCIPAALCAGELLAVMLLAASARRRLGLRARPSLARSEPIRRIASLTRFELAGSLITRINPLVDQLMAGLAGVTGGGTLVRYAADIASLPTSALQAVLFPVLHRRLALDARAPAPFAATTRKALAAVVGLTTAVSALLIAFRGPLCQALFLRGAMDAVGVGGIAKILPWALVGCAPFGALLVLARAHVALQNGRIMPGMGVLNAALNALLNGLLVGPLGLSGIALSTSLTYTLVAIVFWFRLPKET